MIVGLIVTALGLTVCVRADLGISPITTLAYALNRAFPTLSLGTYVFFQHVVFFILTVALLRKDFSPFNCYSFPVPSCLAISWISGRSCCAALRSIRISPAFCFFSSDASLWRSVSV